MTMSDCVCFSTGTLGVLLSLSVVVICYEHLLPDFELMCGGGKGPAHVQAHVLLLLFSLIGI